MLQHLKTSGDQTCVKFARTDGGGDVGTVPLPAISRVRHQLPAWVTLDQTAVIGRVLLLDAVPTEEARSTVIVDEELLVACAGPEGVCCLVAHVMVCLALAHSQEAEEESETEHVERWTPGD